MKKIFSCNGCKMLVICSSEGMIKCQNYEIITKKEINMKKAVNYPESIKKIFIFDINNIEKCFGETGRIIKEMALRDTDIDLKSKFFIQYIEEKEREGLMFSILIPTGEIFSGISILKPKNKDNPSQALLVSSGRAFTSYKQTAKDRLLRYHFKSLTENL